MELDFGHHAFPKRFVLDGATTRCPRRRRRSRSGLGPSRRVACRATKRRSARGRGAEAGGSTGFRWHTRER
ncbi:hypothetical protein A33M_2836 [Rhodovulum sp. PH10]|nr:hypothetical protein A33M_2836 [Rhodovulum sp. PH10]